MKTAGLFRPALAASLALHAAAFLLVRVDVSKAAALDARSPVMLRRLAVSRESPRPVSPLPPQRALPRQTPRPVPGNRAAPQPEQAERPAGRAAEIRAGSESPSAAPLFLPPAAAGRPGGSPMEEESLQRERILREINSRLLKEMVYPPLARRRGLEGRVMVLLVLDEGGGAEELRVSGSSGHSILDRAALELVSRILPLEGGTSGRLSLEIPITYRLND